ncbi:unnamed protein product, partial [Ectocarpus sp. 6 AP-2014]
KPSSVVPEHRKQAICVWSSILLAVLLCKWDARVHTIWQVIVLIDQQEHPSTAFNVSNDRFAFPYVSVCLEDGFGCYHPDGSTDDCVQSAIQYSDAEYEGETIEAEADQQYPNCVGFDLSQFEVPEGEREGPQRSVLLVMYWTASEDPTAETEYSESVEVVLGGPDDNEEITTVPYSRNLESSTEEIYAISAMTIGKTHRTFLDKDPVTSYPALTVSTTTYVVPERSFESDDDDGETDDSSGSSDHAMGLLYLQISQGSYSLTEVEDIEPQLLGTFLGNVGGFWELLLLAWGLCFISTLQARGGAPTMQGRKFTGCCGGTGTPQPSTSSKSSAHQVQPGARKKKSSMEKGDGAEDCCEEDMECEFE